MGREAEDINLILGPDSPGHRAVYLLGPDILGVYYSDSFMSTSGMLPFPTSDKKPLNSFLSKDVSACGLLSTKGYFWLPRE